MHNFRLKEKASFCTTMLAHCNHSHYSGLFGSLHCSRVAWKTGKVSEALSTQTCRVLQG